MDAIISAVARYVVMVDWMTVKTAMMATALRPTRAPAVALRLVAVTAFVGRTLNKDKRITKPATMGTRSKAMLA